jgi:hypothetical protein
MKPRWLLNENFPEPSVTRLRSRGWDVVAVGEISPAPSDLRRPDGSEKASPA